MTNDNLINHIRHFGADGRFTYHAGLSIEDAAKDGAVAQVKNSTVHQFNVGYVVVIAGTRVPVKVTNVVGVFLKLSAYGSGEYTEFMDIKPKYGKYLHGIISIYQGHVLPIESL